MILSGCGGSDQPSPEAEAPARASFPSASGKSIEQIAALGQRTDFQFVPAGKVLEPGVNRFGFAVFNPQGEQQTDLDVAIYATKGPDQPVLGPFPAAVESLTTEPAFQAQTTSQDPGAAKAVYVVNDLRLPTAGQWFMLALAREGSGYIGAQLPNAQVRRSGVVAIGDAAPVVSTPTAQDVGGQLEKIDTRIPPDALHADDLQDVLGEKPVVLLFSTPQLCESRVCGPVVDVQAQVAEETGEDISFIHSEIYRENDPNKGVTEPVGAFRLPTEPWLFVIDQNGTVRQRIEGAFGLGELRRAVAKIQGRDEVIELTG